MKSLVNLLLADEGDKPFGPSSHLMQKGLKDVFCVLNHVICDLFLCTSNVSEIEETRFMHVIANRCKSAYF